MTIGPNSTTITIDRYTVRKLDDRNWIIETPITRTKRKVDKNEPDETYEATNILGYYGTLAAAMRGLLREQLGNTGKQTASRIEATIKACEARLTAACERLDPPPVPSQPKPDPVIRDIKQRPEQARRQPRRTTNRNTESMTEVNKALAW